VTSYRGEIGLNHKLFDSLESHLDLHWRESDFAGTTERQFGPTGRLNYIKQTPWGNLNLGYALTVDQVERNGGTGSRLIPRESLTLHTNTNNFLSQPAVIDASIQAFTSDGLAPLIEGFDYELIHQGNRTALRIIPGGRLIDGQVVLVDYSVEFTSNIRFTSTDQDFHANYDFERFLRGLSIYYRWHDLAALGAPKDDLSILEFTDQLAGFTYRWHWLTWREEYDMYRSNFSDYNQLLSQLEGLHNVGSRLKLGWHLGATLTDYQNQPGMPSYFNYDNAYYAGASLRGPLRTNGYWELGAEARKERGQTDETLLGVLGKLGMRWRKTKVEAGVRVEDRKRHEAQRNRSSIFLQFSREF
jgi:hypothetical protein